MFEKMVLLLDTSELSEAVIPYALYLANKMGSELDVVNVIESEYISARLIKAYLDKIVEEIKEPGIKKKRSVVLRGNAADQILDYIEINKIDIVAMTSRGFSGIKRWVIGSTATKIICGTHIPVLLIHSKEKTLPLVQAVSFNHILLPLDGSRTAEETFGYAERIVSKQEGKVSLLRVVPPVIDQYAGPDDSYVVGYTEKVLQALQEEAEDYLQQTAKSFHRKGISVDTTMVVGYPATEILEYIEKQKTDLVIMSTHGRTGLGRCILGSVADKILHSVNIPLLLIRTH